MRKPTYLVLAPLALAFAGCAQGSAADPDPDARVVIDDPDAGEEPHLDAAPSDGPVITPIDAAAIDAMPIDAMPIDAMPIDACVPIVTQRLTNPNFDLSPMGTGWVQLPQNPTYPPVDNQLTVGEHTAPNGLWLGGLLSSTDALYQDVTLNSTATTIRLTGYKWFATEETGGTFDFLRVQIRNAATDAVLETLVTWSNVDTNTAWTPFTLTATGNYAGQTIRLYVQSQTDSTLNTNFFLDTFALNVTACP